MKNLSISVLIATLFFANLFVSLADTKQDIENANKNGKIVFLVVTERGNPNTKEAMNLAEKAQKSISKSTVLELDRTSIANHKLVQTYRLAGAPTPLILVIATNGFVAGGAPTQNLTPEQLVNMVPSPKEEDVLKAIYEGNSVFVIFSKQFDSNSKKQLDACQSACKSLKDKATIINLDIDDKNEKTFINKFKFDKNASFPITYVINAQGQISSMFNGITEAKSLVEAANKKVSSGCCPPSSGKVCK
ncbi:MAG: hypothetical protein A2X61_00985 [Ignavibacteria bacterium GWB2_35_12]|nr:MAG: hypothetical protein A2X63_01455 [Ignavibacteria bacterium GWA2_35_8]OGU39054.1 MAG: hypothetical protein A2X61_00985 [Ignavibacteria bacterium GWB2_35_12]OGU87901.1 MAG: hypothetical protein A2220_10310 [Ignavibacteria bacterium RIFOXYA2_FULL_35_10]OGV21763.1 MAG: hypothetical protein A2475_04210 [Ignavibacteria bacterium RIFOXYC2_FULL_35_21]